MGLLILSKCDSHNNSWLLQFQYKKLKIKKVKAFTEENKQTDKQMIKLKLTAVVYIYNSLNSFNPNSDQHLISLYLITAKSFIKTMRIKKMITTLQLLHIFFLSIPNKRYREEYKECGHWCWGLNKWQRTFVRERCSLFCHEQGTKEKNFESPWDQSHLRRLDSVLRYSMVSKIHYKDHIWHTLCILFTSAMSIASCLANRIRRW